MAVVVGFVSTYKINLVDTDKVNAIKSVLVENTEVEELNILERTAKTLTVSNNKSNNRCNHNLTKSLRTLNLRYRYRY